MFCLRLERGFTICGGRRINDLEKRDGFLGLLEDCQPLFDFVFPEGQHFIDNGFVFTQTDAVKAQYTVIVEDWQKITVAAVPAGEKKTIQTV